jgi:hypothetical protein
MVFGGAGRSATTADGTFSLPAAVGIRARIALGLLQPGLCIADVRQGGVSVFDAGSEVTAEPLPIQVVVNADGGTVKGSLHDAFGKILSGTTVVLVPKESRRQNRTLYRTAGSAVDGKFALTSVPPVEYKLFSWPAGLPGGSFYSAAFLERYEDRGQPLTVGPSATLETGPLKVLVD